MMPEEQKEDHEWLKAIQLIYGEGPKARGDFIRHLRLLKSQGERVEKIGQVTTVAIWMGFLGLLWTAISSGVTHFLEGK